ncbi:MAG: glutamine--fructose-6-phosphate transaminase (isomerizing) [Clostridia bacterium]|nr:glutamine--fructose-6-phosphate transaminase (isomerizing) [Clostridia bacterium]NLF20371.1 glutamine--fructose-6-phosphate transaminase (isomerizing) [Clostridiaceae bacterium]
MCGIIGYIGQKNVTEVLLNGLRKLEYRGYDSAGVALLEDNGIEVVKCKGRLAILEEKLTGNCFGGRIGIGHTRWATHGEPNDSNSHPHLSNSEKIAVVHNGIIENYLQIKEFLVSKGYRFYSETDSEVVSNLIEYNYRGDLIAAVTETLNDIEGSYALGVVCTDCPQQFVAARKDSPLIVGLGKGENFIASDIPALLAYTREVYILEDREVVRVSSESVEIFNLLGERVEHEIFHVDWDVAAAEKGGFEHFMIKEISEEPHAMQQTLWPRLQGGEVVLENSEALLAAVADCHRINIVACGTAYHAGVVGKYLIEKLVRVPVEVDVASEFRYRDPLVEPGQLTIIISQSGETLDTLMAMREAKRKGSRTLAVVNVVGSSIAREADDVLYTWAGPEIAVASTKAYNTQLAALYLLTLAFARAKGLLDTASYLAYQEELRLLPDRVAEVLAQKDAIQKFAAAHFNAKSVFFIGRGLDYALALEASLKLKEIAYIHSEAYAGGELKHGTIALIEPGTLVVCPLTQEALFDKMLSNIREVKARGAVVLAITPAKYAAAVAQTADAVLTIPDMDSLFSSAAAVTPLQLFAYYVSLMRGNDVDKPRNLAKSVTVE